MRVEFRDLTVRYGRTTAIDGLTCTLEDGKIYGLLGRNGAGKTSLLSVLAAFRRADGGEVLVDGRSPFENAAVTRDICFIRDRVDQEESERVERALAFAAALRPNWDHAYAEKLVRLFKLPLRTRVKALSRGMTSALAVTIGLAARAPLTIFDESFLGLDAPSRYAFYDELLAEYLARPRTIIISTHLIEEVGRLFEEVIVVHRGRLVLHDDTDAVRSRGAAVTGPAETVDRFVEGLTVLAERSLGPTKSAMVYGGLSPERVLAARGLDLDLGPIGLQDLFVHLTSDDERAMEVSA
jgi:ABC-2 type transport system ATP-binding protein